MYKKENISEVKFTQITPIYNNYNTPLNMRRRVSDINFSLLFKGSSPVSNVLMSPKSAKTIRRILNREIEFLKKDLNAERIKYAALDEEIFEMKNNEKKFLLEIEE